MRGRQNSRPMPSSGVSMMSLTLLLAVAAAVPVAMAAQPLPVEERTWMTTLRQAPPATRAKAVLAKMQLDEKLAMLHGADKEFDSGTLTGDRYVGNVIGNARLGIPQLNLNDGPQVLAAAAARPICLLVACHHRGTTPAALVHALLTLLPDSPQRYRRAFADGSKGSLPLGQPRCRLRPAGPERRCSSGGRAWATSSVRTARTSSWDRVSAWPECQPTAGISSIYQARIHTWASHLHSRRSLGSRVRVSSPTRSTLSRIIRWVLSPLIWI